MVLEAIVAIDGAIAGGAEGDLRLAATIGAGYGEHLTRTAAIAATAATTAAVAATAATAATTAAAVATAAAATATRTLSRSAAIGATPWLIGEATTGVELLLASSENELVAAIATLQVLILIRHYVGFLLWVVVLWLVKRLKQSCWLI
jgi:hypothetical protein